MRPLGLMTIWKVNDTEPKWEIMKHALFGYYQNGVDYLNQFAQAKGWERIESYSKDTVAYKVGQYQIELSLVQPTGLDLTKETYLEEASNDKKEIPNHTSEVGPSALPTGDSGV